jgi:hypothetical protein
VNFYLTGFAPVSRFSSGVLTKSNKSRFSLLFAAASGSAGEFLPDWLCAGKPFLSWCTD